jgi:AcrR family transcriptional regulator
VSSRPRVPGPEARRRITAATGRLLMEQRFRELTVESVMDEAAISRTVFYRHFASLADIVVALLDDAVVPGPGEVPDPSDPESLRRMLARSVELYALHGHLLVAVEEASHHDAEVERVYRDAFERSVEAAASTLRLPHATARALMHLNAAYLGDVLARDPAGDRDQALATLTAIWSAVVMGEVAPPHL